MRSAQNLRYENKKYLDNNVFKIQICTKKLLVQVNKKTLLTVYEGT